jgi:sec-independent protein translocase protein TatA
MVFVLLFGSGKISGLMGDVAKGIKSLKKGLADETEYEGELESESTVFRDTSRL